jgi:hypothetical protein
LRWPWAWPPLWKKKENRATLFSASALLHIFIK